MVNQSGNGAFTDGLRKVFSYIKDKKYLSRGLYAASTILPAGWSTGATVAGVIAEKAGFGRGRKVKGRKMGKGRNRC